MEKLRFCSPAAVPYRLPNFPTFRDPATRAAATSSSDVSSRAALRSILPNPCDPDLMVGDCPSRKIGQYIGFGENLSTF